MNYKKSKLMRIVAGFVGFSMTLSLVLVGGGASAAHAAALTQSQINAIITLLQSFGADQSVVNNVQASLTGGTPTGGGTTGGGPSGVCPYTWSANLTIGSRGTDVLKLQQFLNSDSATRVASSGVGSPGQETSYFGSLSKAAAMKFQNKYAAEVLTPVGLSSGTGYVGPSTRAKLNDLCVTGGVTPPPPPGTPPPAVPAGTGLNVTPNAVQPVNMLAPDGGARVPFTRVNLTAGLDGPVTVNSIVVERTGQASNDSFAGVVLMNENGTLIGIEKTLNSSDQATVGNPFVIPAGTTKTVIIGGNMNADVSGQAGETPALSVVAVNTSATVTGSLPITGATHTVNSNLAIGSISTVARGAFDPGAGNTKEVGLKDYNFSSIKLTAGSNEDLLVKSIRWYQSASASSDDVINVVTVVDGTVYPTTMDGDYYTTVFPGNGISMKKGFTQDFTIRGDIEGGANRTIDFDIDRRTDIHIVGTKFGYGITPPFGSGTTDDAGAFRTTNNPYYDAFQATISQGTMTVSAWTAVNAQNLAVNLANQQIAGFSVDVKGEEIQVASMVFNFSMTEDSGSAVGLNDVDNISLADSNGTVLATASDPTGTGTSGTVTLSDTVTFPVGITNIVLRAKLSTDFATNDTIAASTTPSTQWTSATGQVTGNSITPSPSSGVSGPTMTVKSGSLTVSASSQPTAKTIIAGAQSFEFARYILDAGGSGEDVRITTLPLDFSTNGTATDLTGCKLHDGIGSSAPSLTTGSNILNPSSTSSTTSFTFDGSLTVPKGTSKTLSLRCNLSTGTSGNVYQWGLVATADNGSYTGASGKTSGQTITEAFVRSAGQRMTSATSGSYTVSNDTSVLYKISKAGTSGVTLAKLKFEAGTSENVDLKGVALALSNVASNSPADLVGEKVTLWHNGTEVGSAQFGTGNSDYATSTLSTPVRIVKGEEAIIEIRGDLSIHDAVTGTPGAFVTVDYDGDNNGLNGNYATGVDSGATISGTSGDTSTNGTRIYRAVPTLADVTTTYNSGLSLAAGSDLYAIRVTAAPGRDVTIRAMTFDVLATGVSDTSGWQLYGPTGAVNATGIATSTSGAAGAGGSSAAVGADGRRLRINFDGNATDQIVPAGTSKDYRLQASTVSGLTSTNSETIAIFLLSDTGVNKGVDTAGTDLAQVVDIEGTVAAAASTTDRLIWSPNSTTTSSVGSAVTTQTEWNNLDWVNGYGLPGYPGVGQNFGTRVLTH